MKSGEQVLGTAELQAAVQGDLSAWQVEEGHLCRRFATAHWKASLMVVNTIGLLAELAFHHPELRVGYAHVDVRLRTHQPDGLTPRDLALARKIEQVLSWLPGAESGSGLDGPPPGDAVAAVWRN